MKYFSVFKGIILLFLTLSIKGYSQENQSAINFFLECEDCDLTFIRQELTFISFVRDPLLADVHILVTDSKTGGDGHKYFLNFLGKKKFEGVDNDYTVITNQPDTEDDIRRTLLKTIKVGILQYYSRTGYLERLNINIEDKENKKADEMLIDPWNKWIFRFESGGEFQKEESQNRYSLKNETRIQKVTEEWKGSLEALYEINRENFYDEGNLITNKQDTREISARYIKSLTNRWSARIYGEYLSRTYLNIKHKFDTSLAAEYNIFPWNESHKRVLALRYNIAVSSYNYIEETIYDKMEEHFFLNLLRFIWN